MADPVSAIALGSAASATAGTAATAGLFGFGGSFSLMSTLSTIGTIGGVLGTLQQGKAEKALHESEARMNRFNAKQEEIRGLEEANEIRRDVARAIASSNARGAASGIDISSGSPLKASEEALRDANDALSTAGTNAKIRAETERVRAELSRQRGRNAVRASRSKAVSILGDFGSGLQERGFSF